MPAPASACTYSFNVNFKLRARSLAGGSEHGAQAYEISGCGVQAMCLNPSCSWTGGPAADQQADSVMHMHAGGKRLDKHVQPVWSGLAGR